MYGKTVHEKFRIFGGLLFVFLVTDGLTLLCLCASLTAAMLLICVHIPMLAAGVAWREHAALVTIDLPCIAVAAASYLLHRHFNPSLKTVFRRRDSCDEAAARRLLKRMGACRDRLDELTAPLASDGQPIADECRDHLDSCVRCRHALDHFFARKGEELRCFRECLGPEADEPPREPVDYGLLTGGACADRAETLERLAFWLPAFMDPKLAGCVQDEERLGDHLGSCVGCRLAAERIVREHGERFHDHLIQSYRERKRLLERVSQRYRL